MLAASRLSALLLSEALRPPRGPVFSVLPLLRLLPPRGPSLVTALCVPIALSDKMERPPRGPASVIVLLPPRGPLSTSRPPRGPLLLSVLVVLRPPRGP